MGKRTYLIGAALAASPALLLASGVVPFFEASAQEFDQRTMNQIKARYRSAVELYEQERYADALGRLAELEQLAGGTRLASAQNLKVKILVAMGRYSDARSELDILYDLDMSAAILADVAEYEPKIARGIEAERARIEEERRARVERERRAAAERERVAREERERRERRAREARERELAERHANYRSIRRRFDADPGAAWSELSAYAERHPDDRYADQAAALSAPYARKNRAIAVVNSAAREALMKFGPRYEATIDPALRIGTRGIASQSLQVEIGFNGTGCTVDMTTQIAYHVGERVGGRDLAKTSFAPQPGTQMTISLGEQPMMRHAAVIEDEVLEFGMLDIDRRLIRTMGTWTTVKTFDWLTAMPLYHPGSGAPPHGFDEGEVREFARVFSETCGVDVVITTE